MKSSPEAKRAGPAPARGGAPGTGWRLANDPRRRAGAFTLIEVMVVVAIMGVILAIGVPSILRALSKEGMRAAVSDLVDICSNARARAVLGGKTTLLVFHPLEHRVEISGGGGESRTGAGGSAISAIKLPEDVGIEMLDINLLEYRDSDSARVRFFPNGTSDEMTLVLRSADGEWRAISLEITTGLASVETDPQRFGR